jgi:DNA invertase Pin-like site-specific DNA recombinase
MNYAREELNHNTTWHGRKPKQLAVQLWQATHPNGKKCECIRELEIDRKTVDKWWKKSEAEQGKTPAKQDNKHDT